MIAPTEEERAALRDLERALERGWGGRPGQPSAGARRKEVRRRLEALAGRLQDHPSPAAWLEAREGALLELRRELGRELGERQGGPAGPSSSREAQDRRICLTLDLLEVLGRLAELREIRERLAETRPGSPTGEPS